MATDATRTSHALARDLLSEIWRGLGGDSTRLDRVRFHGAGALASPFAVTDLAAAVFAAAGSALGELLEAAGADPVEIDVDRVLASGWFYLPPGPSEPLTGPPPRIQTPWMTEFATADGRWLRVQGAFPTLRSRIFDVLGTPADIDAVASVVRRYPADEIEQLLVDGGAAAAVDRSVDEWLAHPAGRAVHAEPIAHIEAGGASDSSWQPTPGRPLAGIKVLDLTRVAAGPFATRFLAACGAEVLRVDAPGSDESSTPFMAQPNDLNLGKRWAILDAARPEGRDRLLELLSEADIFVHGYRPNAIDRLISPEERRRAKPDLVEVGLRAYGWTGPWQDRRGFDTLVQFSSGIAQATQAWALADPAARLPLIAVGHEVDASRPRHMPVEALDLATGYQIATAAIRGLTRRLVDREGSTWRFSIARTASILIGRGEVPQEGPSIELPLTGPWEDRIYSGATGPVRRLRFPLEVEGNPLFWERPADRAGGSTPCWVTP